MTQRIIFYSEPQNGSMKTMKACEVYRYCRETSTLILGPDGKRRYRLDKNKRFYYTNEKRGMFLNWIGRTNKTGNGPLFLKLQGSAALDVNQSVRDFLLDAKELKEATDGRIDMFRLGRPKHCALEFFLETVESLPFPDTSIKEQEWLQGSYKGGLQYGKKGFQGIGHKYDFTSFYPSIMNSDIEFPHVEGRFCVLETLDAESLAIYRGTIAGDSPFFRGKGEYFTDADLNMAEYLGLEFTLANDGNCNAMIYDNSITGTKVFGKYVDYLFPLKQQGIKVCKKLLNTLYGVLGERQRSVCTIRPEDNLIDVTNMDISELKPVTPDVFHVQLIDNEKQIFKHPKFARYAPFITSYGRLQLLNTFIEHHILGDVVQCHTDGWISTTEIPVDREVSKELGGIKHEYSGYVHVHHVNKVRDKDDKKV